MQDVGRHNWLMVILLAMLATVAQGQVPSVTLTCREKLVQVGRPFEIELSVRHPERMIVVFPDTAIDFKPYEVHSGLPIPTSTNEGLSEDVKIYQLYTWEIDSVQHLQFPVYYVTEKGDTQQVLSNTVDVEFQPSIPAYSDTLKVKAISDLAVIREPINWVAWGIIFTVCAIVIVAAVLLLSKPISRMYRRAKIEREWRRYRGQLEALRAMGGDQAQFYPGLNKVWRGYFDRDWYLALGSRTTEELNWVVDELKALDDDDKVFLVQLSHTSDMVLYADRPQPDAQAVSFWNAVQRIMQKEYKRRKEAVEV